MRSLLLLLVSLTLPIAAQAKLYTYVDDNGLRHYTNVPSDARARVIKLPNHQYVPSGTRIHLNYKGYANLQRFGRRPASTASVEDHILRASMEHQVDPLLIKAIIKTESNFNQFAISSHGAQGLMQLMPETARDLQVTDPFDAYQNISAGTRYFRYLLDTFSGNIRLSLAAYNAGPSRVAPNGVIPHIPETIDYVRTVLRHYRTYKRMTSRLPTSINLRRLVTVN